MLKNAKRNITLILAAIIVLITLSLFLQSQNKVIYGVSSGTYSVIDEYELLLPNITFDMQNNQFTFTYDFLSSYLNTGKIKIENKKIIATTDDNKYTYIFKIIDDNTIKFVENGSSKVVDILGNVVITDGTEFKFVDQR